MSLYRPAWRMLLVLYALFLLLLPFKPAAAQEGRPGPSKTESPYFFVQSDSPELDRLPLKSTKVSVRIVGVIADVTVTQQYKNEGSRPLEARYVFPGSTRAAVYGMNVRLGERLLTAKIREKQQARIEYEDAKREGRTAALLEQHRENVFQMNVANILPGDDVRVELRYTELIVPTDGRYQFVFPSVVGPRYNGAPANGKDGGGTGEKWIATPYLRQGQASTAGFSLELHVATPIPLESAGSPSHRIELEQLSKEETRVQLAANGGSANDRDFIFDYRLAGDQIQSGLVLARGKDENFFLAMVEPPAQAPLNLIVPREYVFVMDISGSMHGFPLDTAKALLSDLIGSLRPSDTFNVMLFSGSNRMLAPQSVPATRANIDLALRTIREQGGSGSTELLPALRKALALPREADRARSFVVVTDGYVSVEREAFDLIRRNLSEANLFAFGIGSAVNRHLIEGMARAGQGEPFIVTSPAEAGREAQRLRRMIDSPVLTHVKARFEGLDVYDVEPLSVPDVFARRPVVIFGKWRGEPKGRLVLEGHAADGPYSASLNVDPAAVSERNAALRYLWARHRIAALSDQETLEGGGAYRQAILDLGLQYNLLTQYTSFIAIDRIVRNPTPAASAAVGQPSPLPQGVSDLAVGAEVPSTPEPATWLMLAMTGLSLVWWLRRRAAAN
jgi:Ca-activated chloride channel family protein